MVESVNGFGSGVAGLSVLTHTHTPSMVESRMAKALTQGILLSTTVLKAHALPIRVLPIVVHP